MESAWYVVNGVNSTDRQLAVWRGMERRRVLPTRNVRLFVDTQIRHGVMTDERFKQLSKMGEGHQRPHQQLTALDRFKCNTFRWVRDDNDDEVLGRYRPL